MKPSGCTCSRSKKSPEPKARQTLSTQILLDALANRPGVEAHFVALAEPFHIVIGGGRKEGLGSAMILVVPTG